MSTKPKTEKAATVPAGIKLHDLAKDIGVTSKVLLEKATELGIKAKSYAAVLTAGQADRLRAKLGGAKKLKEDLEENKTRLAAKKPVKAKAGKGAPKAEAEIEAEPGAEAEPAAIPALAETMPSLTEEAEAAPHPEPVAEVAQESPAPEAVAEAAPLPPPPADAKEVEAPPPEPVVAAEKESPSSSVVVGPPPAKAPRRILSVPEVAPPVQRPAPKLDARFGVVVPASEAEKQAPPPQKGRRGAPPVQVESKFAVDDFKPQVSYPAIPEAARMADDEESKAARVGGAKRVVRGMPGLKGFSTGPRRGVALLRGDDERHRTFRRPKHQKTLAKPVAKREGPAVVTSPVTIKGLCEALGIKATDLIRKFIDQGKLTVKINTVLSDADAELYALEFDPLKHGVIIKKARDVEEEMLKKAEIADKPEDLRTRAPVVTIMGHVDHGKTSLLDYIRQTKVAAGEVGGITQHIGAYRVPHTKGSITFLDTPGHKAFTEMRARGANVTDVVVLVVAANDGVMPQTEEAISHARQASKKIVVALNKVDLPDSNPDKVKGQLAAKELFVEGYGGDVGCVEVSAKTGQGVDALLDRILLEAEVLELKANPSKPAAGTVIEAHKDQGRGIVCTLLVHEGVLRQGDVIICGHAYGSIRQLLSDTGQTLEEAGPSTPVLVTGLSEVPLSGERFHVLESIKEAAAIASQRAMRMRQEGLGTRTHVTLETLSDMLKQGAIASLNLVLKVDVQGSLTPLRNAINELSTGEARIDILHDGVGAINETDVLLADASDAIVIGFSITADPNARRLAEERGVDIRIYNIIYEVVDEMRQALEGLLKPIEREVVHGHATVRQVFRVSKTGPVAGCFIADGNIQRNNTVRLLREGKPVWNGKIASLKRFKEDVKEVRTGFECGIKLEGHDDVKPGDTIEAYSLEQVKRTLAK
jgi:translation initiation factor IF-2